MQFPNVVPVVGLAIDLICDQQIATNPRPSLHHAFPKIKEFRADKMTDMLKRDSRKILMLPLRLMLIMLPPSSLGNGPRSDQQSFGIMSSIFRSVVLRSCMI